MKNLSIARRYAKALLLIGKEDGKAQLYRDELDGVTQAIDAQPDLKQTISNPLYDAAGRRGLLMAVIQKLNPSKELQQFLLLLFDKGRFGFLDEVNDFYQKLADDLGLALQAIAVAHFLYVVLDKEQGRDMIADNGSWNDTLKRFSQVRF